MRTLVLQDVSISDDGLAKLTHLKELDELDLMRAPLTDAALAEVRRAMPSLRDLTAREQEVLVHFLDGLSVETIARHLYVSAHTVRNHLKAIFTKVGVRSQAELRERFSGRSEPARHAYVVPPPGERTRR